MAVESPYAGNVEANLAYARRAMADCLRRGESPFLSHALYTQVGVLDDSVVHERRMGIVAGFAWMDVAHAVVLYMDLGMSGGMRLGLDRALQLGLAVERRWLDSDECQACIGGADDPNGSCNHCTNGRVPKART